MDWKAVLLNLFIALAEASIKFKIPARFTIKIEFDGKGNIKNFESSGDFVPSADVDIKTGENL